MIVELLDYLPEHFDSSQPEGKDDSAYFTTLITLNLTNFISRLLNRHDPILEKEDLSSARVEFEVEKEQRIIVKLEGYSVDDWKNSFDDIYDASGQFRVRVKCGKPRISIKIPLPAENTFRAKCCMRFEITPSSEEHFSSFFKIKDELSQQPGSQRKRKLGAKITLTDGRQVWINKASDSEDESTCWIEVDDPEYEIERYLPEGITYVGHAKSFVESTEVHGYTIEQFTEDYLENVLATSRTSNGEYNTSVSEQKENISLTPEKLKDIVRLNSADVCDFIWQYKYAPITSQEELSQLLYSLANLVVQDIGSGLHYRTWDVKYGKQVPPAELETFMDEFFENLWERLKEAEKGKHDAGLLACWIEWMIDREIHPFADACSRIAKAWSTFILMRLDTRLPQYGSRKEYYNALNQGWDGFWDYYLRSFAFRT